MKAGSNLGTVNAYLYGGAGDDFVTAVFHKAKATDTSVGNLPLRRERLDTVTTNMSKTAVVSGLEKFYSVA